jgi:hypothetical protein
VRLQQKEKERRRLQTQLQKRDQQLALLKRSARPETTTPSTPAATSSGDPIVASLQRHNTNLSGKLQTLKIDNQTLQDCSSHTTAVELALKSQEYYSEVQRLRGVLWGLGYRKEPKPVPASRKAEMA